MDWLFLDKPATYNLLEYEARLNHVLSKHNDPVICNYDPSKFGRNCSDGHHADAPACNHRGLLRENPFFVPHEQFLHEMRERRLSRTAVA